MDLDCIKNNTPIHLPFFSVPVGSGGRVKMESMYVYIRSSGYLLNDCTSFEPGDGKTTVMRRRA